MNGSNDVPGYRFSPPSNVFSSVEENPENECFCPHGPPCTPSGFFNVSLCQYGEKNRFYIAYSHSQKFLKFFSIVSDSPILLSFPHFYLANDSYRTAFEGITPPDPEKHKMYLDVQPVRFKKKTFHFCFDCYNL